MAAHVSGFASKIRNEDRNPEVLTQPQQGT